MHHEGCPPSAATTYQTAGCPRVAGRPDQGPARRPERPRPTRGSPRGRAVRSRRRGARCGAFGEVAADGADSGGASAWRRRRPAGPGSVRRAVEFLCARPCHVSLPPPPRLSSTRDCPRPDAHRPPCPRPVAVPATDGVRLAASCGGRCSPPASGGKATHDDRGIIKVQVESALSGQGRSVGVHREWDRLAEVVVGRPLDFTFPSGPAGVQAALSFLPRGFGELGRHAAGRRWSQADPDGFAPLRGSTRLPGSLSDCPGGPCPPADGADRGGTGPVRRALPGLPADLRARPHDRHR